MKNLFFLLFSLLFVLPTQAQSPKHEVRAVWLTTVGGLDWPQLHNASQQQAELCQTLDRLRQAGINTILFQARVRATTIYPSRFEPWDARLTGVQGRSPGYDPLQFCIDECHRRGMECHAWVVTLPIGKWNKLGCKELRKKHPKLVKRIGEDAYLDPENPQTARYLADVCAEIADNYDVDGLHLDYIRYPENMKTRLSKAQCRENITRIVREIHKTVKLKKPWLKLSCSPIGKFRDLTRYSAGGWNAYNRVCQDAQGWLREGLMDQIYPMMYFRDNQFFPFAIDWQEQSAGRTVVPGLGIYFLDPREGKWTLDVVERQMHVLRQLGLGHCYFRTRFFVNDVKGIYQFGSRFDAIPALVPPMTWQGTQPPTAPTQLTLSGHMLRWSGASDPSGAPYLLYNVYASEVYPVDTAMACNLVATRLRADSLLVPRHDMYYAVTAMNRYGQESAPVQLPAPAVPQRPMASKIMLTTGQALTLPAKDAALDADFVVIETMAGVHVATRPYAPTLQVADLPAGIYQLRSLGRKGRSHRLGFFAIKPSR